MKLVTAAEMRDMDKLASSKYGIPGLLLMDQAAKAVADVALRPEYYRKSTGGKVVIFCGKGNNGGDGFGAARYIVNAGKQVSVYLVNATVDMLQGDAAKEAEMLHQAGVTIVPLLTAQDLNLAEVKALRADVIIDAMLGTGFTGELRGLYKDVCHMLADMDKKIVAVDIPTGVDADFGLCAEDALRATVTVTMVLPKTGLLLYPGKAYVGELVVADIGMPQKLVDDYPSKRYLVDVAYVVKLLPERAANAHKGNAGRVVVTAGSPGFIGAAAMSSYAAVKAGAGLVSLLTPQSSSNVLSMKLTEVMVHGLLESMPGVLGGAAAGDIVTRTAKADALAIGPGLGTAEKTQQAVLNVLSKVTKPVVIDADAITALKDHMEVLRQMQAPKVLTPHPGEMARITGVAIEVVDRERLNVATHYAQEWQAVVVLKGAPTVIALPDGTTYVNPTGSSAMATGGSGDVLTGILAAYIASGMEIGAAAVAAVYLHGLAGQLASKDGLGLAANEISYSLPVARKSLFTTKEVQFSIYNSSLKVVK